ncbi:uncharacterized protein ACA1_215780 [Acanthamoeba castellanii str. Neff]|uniref:Uncharacterized protein n=1 Tax=Acanthamoeba castellanii (strain ATCC 30010 / Neff) TaxID=1257118 RepID=L8GSN1_ACACF|nr:uncharacterized protein ACA1_215780 [Acanthamoeba castellanii str. Neff]ELR15106.1 hypothetical protein ACA1_215780 [Acanthamoeba castellanii str. Neff]
MVRNQSTVGKADSIGEAIDKWETTELEKVEAKAKLLGSIFCVDHADMKDQLLKNNNVMAGSVVNLLVHNQKEARKVRVQESERKKRIAQEEQAKRAKAQKLRVQAKLEEKRKLMVWVVIRFQLIPKEEIMTIYKECDGDMEATIDELLYLVALTEAKMREAEEKKRRAEMEEQMRQSQRKDKEKQEKKAKKEKLKKNKKAERAGSGSGSVNEEEREKAVIMNFIESLSHGEVTAELASIEDTADKNALAVSLAQEQFDSLTREEIEEVLAKHHFTLTEEASANLLQASENKQVQVLLLAFDKEFEEWEIRDLLSDHDWDGAAVTVALNARLDERKKKREEAEKERAKKALEAEAEAAQKQKTDAAAAVAAAAEAQKQRESTAQAEERKLQSEKRLTIRRVKKTENLGNHFEKQMRERQEAQAQQQLQNTAQQQQKFEGARQQLVKNLQEEQEKPSTPTAAATSASAAADSEFVDHFLEVRKARAVGARGRRAPSRKPRGATTKEAEPESGQDD